MQPEMTPVKSSNIKAVAFDKAGSKLHVHFVHGGEYIYHDVPYSLHQELLKADSLGTFFHNNIRNKYKFTKSGASTNPGTDT